MKCLVLTLLACGLFPIFAVGASAGIDHAEIEKHFNGALKEFNERVVPQLKPKQAAVWRQTRVDLRYSQRLIAHAGYAPGTSQRTITISTGLVHVIRNLSATSVHSSSLRAGPCHFEYLLTVNESIEEGWLINERATRPEDLYEIDCSCARFSFPAMIESRAGSMMTQGGLRLTLFYVFLHELAHHVLGHTDTEGGDRDELEVQADAWAISAAQKARLTFQDVVPTFAFIFLVDDEYQGIESAEKRLANLVTLVAESLDPETGVTPFGPEIARNQSAHVKQYAGFFQRLEVHKEGKRHRECEKQTAINYAKLLDGLYFED